MITRPDNDTQVNQPLDPLVNGRTRYTAIGSYIFERNTCILGDNLQNLFVKVVNFFHTFIAYYIIL